VSTHEIWLRSLPVSLHAFSTEHSDELQREFKLVRANSDDASTTSTVPGRLLDLIEQLSVAYRGISEGPAQRIDEAIARGEDSIDLVYEVPAAVREATMRLAELFEEADEFCRAGDHLLTLESPPAVRAYRRWFLDQFIDQIDGKPAETWEEWARHHAPELVSRP
jgi:hypothetical protein